MLLVAFAIGLFWYFVPALVATSRRNPNASAIFMLNLCFGWSLIGWVIALRRACAATPSQLAPSLTMKRSAANSCCQMNRLIELRTREEPVLMGSRHDVGRVDLSHEAQA